MAISGGLGAFSPLILTHLVRNAKAKDTGHCTYSYRLGSNCQQGVLGERSRMKALFSPGGGSSLAGQ